MCDVRCEKISITNFTYTQQAMNFSALAGNVASGPNAIIIIIYMVYVSFRVCVFASTTDDLNLQ